MIVEETVYYYEMTDRTAVRPARIPDELPRLERVTVVCPAFNRFLYAAVGSQYLWTDRLGWSESQWQELLERAGHETWAAYSSGNPCGYFEIEHVDDEVRIDYFGLLDSFRGCGLGGWLLTQCLERAWALLPRRVTLNTSSFDHPLARKNYHARGFVLIEQKTKLKTLDNKALNSWGVAE